MGRVLRMSQAQTTETGDPIPGFSSFGGYTGHLWHGRKCVKVCMDCPDKAQADAWVMAQGFVASHTLCPKCYYKRMATLTGDHSDDD
jgi:hypothetical protein